jgi:hypothetical protein
MKKLIISSFILGILGATSSAHADSSAQTQIEIKGRVATTCTITDLNNSALDYAELADSSGFLDTGNHQGPRTLGKITCNSPAWLSIKSINGAMKTGSGACDESGSTTNCIFHHAKAEWDGIDAELTTNGTPLVGTSTMQSESATTSELVLSLELIGPTTKTLLTGSYSDLLVVKVGGLF